MAEAAVDQFSLSPEELEGIDAKDQPEQKHQKPKPAIMATRTHPGALMPGDFEGLYRLAHIIYHSGFCPKQFTSPEQVFVAIQMGNELGFKPMQSVQGITVINGQPSVWGDTLIGLVEASGQLDDLIENTRGTFPNDDYTISIEVKRRGKKRSTIRSFSVADAKTAGLWKKAGPWTNYPKRMIYMRARAWALRDTFSDVLRGLSIVEEAIDNPVNSALIQDIVAATIAQGAEPEPPIEEPETATEAPPPTEPEPVQDADPEPPKEPKATKAGRAKDKPNYEKKPTQAELSSIYQECGRLGLDPEKVCVDRFGVGILDINLTQANNWLGELKDRPTPPAAPNQPGKSLFEKAWEPQDELFEALNQAQITDHERFIKKVRDHYGKEGLTMHHEIQPHVDAALQSVQRFEEWTGLILGIPA